MDSTLFMVRLRAKVTCRVWWLKPEKSQNQITDLVSERFFPKTNSLYNMYTDDAFVQY